MNSIAQNLADIKSSIGSNVTLVAVSKTKPVELIMEVYNAGHRIFGENRVQELVAKYEAMPKDIQWHLIGHLQRNKVKYIAPFIALIHSVDSEGLLQEIDKQAAKNNRVIDCLLQIFIASEETKFGLNFEEASKLLQSEKLKEYTNIRIVGLMGMATNTDNMEKVSSEFRSLKEFYDKCKNGSFSSNVQFCVLSMGMSSDYRVAIAESSTMVRVGSSIFGHR